MSLGNGASQTKVEPLGKLSRMLRVSMATNRRQPLGAVTLKKQWKLITYHVIDISRGMGRLGVKKSENCPDARNNGEWRHPQLSCKYATPMNTTPNHPVHQPWGKLLPSIWLVFNLAQITFSHI